MRSFSKMSGTTPIDSRTRILSVAKVRDSCEISAGKTQGSSDDFQNTSCWTARQVFHDPKQAAVSTCGRSHEVAPQTPPIHLLKYLRSNSHMSMTNHIDLHKRVLFVGKVPDMGLSLAILGQNFVLSSNIFL